MARANNSLPVPLAPSSSTVLPLSATTWHYPNDLKLVRAWFARPLAALTPPDIDAYIDFALARGHKPNTVSRRLASLASFFSFLDITIPGALPSPVISERQSSRRTDASRCLLKLRRHGPCATARWTGRSCGCGGGAVGPARHRAARGSSATSRCWLT